MSKADREGLGVSAEHRPDGSILMWRRQALAPYAPRVGDAIVAWAKTDPDKIALADRRDGPTTWRTLSYGQLAEQTARVGQALLDGGLGQQRSLLLISDNRIEAAIVTVAAYRAGVALSPMTPAYSAGRGDPQRLSTILDTLKPGLVIVESMARHSAALIAAGVDPANIVSLTGDGARNLDDLLATVAGQGFADAEAAITEDSIAKIMFTSGSTGTPKGAINTHRMLSSNVRAIVTGWPFMEQEPPIVVDWLPWNHTFGGNHNFNTILSTGGALYIDDGKPTPDGMARSLINSVEARPTVHVNVPRGLDLMARLLAADPVAAKAFFERLRVVMFASSGLPARIRDQWNALAAQHATREVTFCSAWGATETAPMATFLNFDAAINNIGVPAPGTTIKLAPVGARLEIRVKGPNVTPGYLGRPELAATAFDEEGFWKSGDVGLMADPADPDAGILIDGRIAEDFKLASGIWVNVGGLRGQLMEHLVGVARDIVISGPQRDELCALVFLDEATDPATAADKVRAVINAHNLTNPTNSRRIAGFEIMNRALDPGAGELTEKGTVNQSAVLQREVPRCDALHGRVQL